MIVGRLEPQRESNYHEDVDEVLAEPRQDHASVILHDSADHQDGEGDVQQVEEDHEAARRLHGCRGEEACVYSRGL